MKGLMMINLIDNLIKWYDYLMMQLMLSFVAICASLWEVFDILEVWLTTEWSKFIIYYLTDLIKPFVLAMNECFVKRCISDQDKELEAADHS